ncbi:ATP-binding protein [Geomesophilobacter sediminis]|uniref:ATP-binding protein n=1 Tax=Geomesophilobacter sediminis TaxID=2798584 RepID=A0A8J7SAW7_9BACT|nr:ATP-binding protein [Geomesophilobacter sediminis]MBJ6727491.1 ATP-binding protein [Geomesophilobacter sediminis]
MSELPQAFTYTIERLDRVLQRVEHLLDGVDPVTAPDPVIFDRYYAFRWEGRGRGGALIPITHPHLFDLDTLVGVDYAKEALVRNTAQFVAGFPANNVLLWGERGTGKSSCIKGLLPRFGAKGLRIIEVQRSDLKHLPLIMAQVRHAGYRFILFCDDLSFAEGDTSYQELKVLLDGGLEARPDHLVVYATSNRRHLMPERMTDNLRNEPGAEIHPEEAVSDKLALADRFGLNLSFTPFNQQTYLMIVERYAEAAGLDIDPETLRKQAIIWALEKGQRSGRAAKQFVDDLAGRHLLGGNAD